MLKNAIKKSYSWTSSGITEAVILLIKFYKLFISPLLPHSCRYYPSCSTYAVEALKKYGLFKGSVKTTYRIIRCNPFAKGGYDPVK